MVNHERKRRGRGRKQAAEAKGAPERKATRSAASYGPLAAAIGAVAVLGFLLYASCKGDDTTASAAPEKAPAEAPARVAEAPQAPQAAPQAAPRAAQAAGAESWNDAQIAWQPYEAGLAKAKAENKPVCLVFHTGWCPHCRNYSRVFEDPRVVAKAHDFVMVRVNPDEQTAIGERHAPDGSYVPRTFFLSPGGEMLADVHAPRPQYIHFYDERDPASLLAGMDAALRKVARPM